MYDDPRLRRLYFQAWHRGTREADYMVGGFFDRYATSLTEDELRWFETLLDEQDVDIMAWGMRTAAVPDHLQGPMMDAFQKLDFIKISN